MQGMKETIADVSRPWQDYATVFALCPDMMCIADKRGVLLDVNPACTRILGFSAEDMVGVSWEHFVHPADVADTRAKVMAQLAGQQVLNFVNRYRCKSGAYRILQWQGLYSASAYLVGTARDITEETQRNELLAKLAQHERRSIRAALHDSVSQQLFGMRLLASHLYTALKAEHCELAERAQCMEQAAGNAAKAVRELMESITPCDSHGGDPARTLRNYADRINRFYGVRCTFSGSVNVVQLQPDVANQLCLMAQEAVINAVKHAQADLISIVLSEAGPQVSVIVRDDGRGIEDKKDGGFGITIMQERARLIGAHLEIRAGRQGGTEVHCIWTRGPGESVQMQ